MKRASKSTVLGGRSQPSQAHLREDIGSDKSVLAAVLTAKHRWHLVVADIASLPTQPSERLRPPQSASFAVARGTGSTLAAEGIAADLVLNLALVFSKYVDENAVHFFDEADGLFGMRGGVKDAHDRCANLQIADLLQRGVGDGDLNDRAFWPCDSAPLKGAH